VDSPKPKAAFVGTFYVGTEALGRPLTDPERKDLSSRLRAHDFVGASLVSLRFAFTLTRATAAAHDLHDRANLRLVRQGWDPLVVTLVKCLCRFVWSEHSHEKRESATARKAEAGFVLEQGIHNAAAASSEDLATCIETEQQEEERAKRRIDAVRAAFVEAGDAVNQLWLDYRLAGVDEPSEMARSSGLDVSAFYRAADRRKRHAAHLVAAEKAVHIEEET
jgi:hypothetical protein